MPVFVPFERKSHLYGANRRLLISENTIQQILSRIDIVDIVGDFVKLKKRGANYLGLCPFHNEKTPSFTVSPSKEIYKCFGCGRSGNAIGFIMEHEKYSYVEAIRWLAQKYNIEVEETELSPEIVAQRQLAESLHIVNEFAQEYFSHTLFETEEGQAVGLSYFQERGFSEDIIRKFQLGYNPDKRDAFARAALKKGYSIEYLQKTGLVVTRNGEPADNYRGRVIFPVHNQTGKVIGFGARILKSNDRAPKYINTPENQLYVKSKLLYGTYFARQAISQADECLLVEGYTDVISLHQAGIENVVASGGTSLTPDQLRLIKKYTGNLTILYDGDAAGVKAALRGLDLALEEGLNVQLALIPDKEDPDSYVRRIGAGAFRDFIRTHKKDFIFFKLEVSLEEAGNDPKRKSELVNQLAETISRINKTEHFTLQQDYIRQCSEILKIDEQGLVSLVNKHLRERLQKQERTRNPAAAAVLPEAAPATEMPGEAEDGAELLLQDDKQERGLVRVLLEHGHRAWDEHSTVAQHIFEAPLEYDLIDNAVVRRILESYKALVEAGQQPETRFFIYHADPEISSLAVAVLHFPYEVSPNWKDMHEIEVTHRDSVYKQDVSSALNYLLLKKIKRLLNENQQDMEKAATPEEQMSCLQLHRHLKEMEYQITGRLGTVILK
ncbi:DNA primase [Compostibacter hankyongensis]|uniref:DNA primase n=1 Tax=Compostibacter hankyongensis TaxID=1007089 RepID=A0ABP8FIW9_9BACT